MLHTASLAVHTLVDSGWLMEEVCCWGGEMDRMYSRKVANAQVMGGQRERVYSLETSRAVATKTGVVELLLSFAVMWNTFAGLAWPGP